MRAVAVGSATIDVYVRANRAVVLDWHGPVEERRYMMLEYGGKLNVPFFVEETGGGGTNIAVGLARLGIEVEFVGALGDDERADRVTDALGREGVSTEHVVRLKGEKTGLSVIVGGPDGERSVLVCRGANSRFDPKTFPWDALDGAAALYLGSLHGAAARLLTELPKRLERWDGVLCWNPGGAQVGAGLDAMRPLLARCDTLVLNRREAEKLTGAAAQRKRVDESLCTLCGACVAACPQHIFRIADGAVTTHNEERCIRCGLCVKVCPVGAVLVEPWGLNLRRIMRDLKESGVGVVVLTDGARGVQAHDGRRFYALPAIAADVVDMLGAGDGFCSGFLGARLLGRPLEEALLWGAAMGASVTEHFGAKDGLLPREKLRRLITERAGDEHEVRVFEEA